MWIWQISEFFELFCTARCFSTSCLISPIWTFFFQCGFSNMCSWKSWKMVIHMLLHLCGGSMHALLQFGSVEAVVGPWGFSPKLAWFPSLMILEGFCCNRYSNLYTQKQDLELRSKFFCVCAYESSTKLSSCTKLMCWFENLHLNPSYCQFFDGSSVMNC